MDFHSFLSLFCNARLRCINCKQHLTGDIAQVMENERTQFDVAVGEVERRNDEAIEIIVAIRAETQLLDDIRAGRDNYITEIIESAAQTDDLEVLDHLLTAVESRRAQYMAICSQSGARILELRARLDALGNQWSEYNEQINA
jgi:hypothetical protein